MELHSDESVERAAITLREIAQELRGRGISAVMILEEQIKALDEYRKDAERYRWLRDEDGAFEAFTAAYYNAKSPADIDAALDAAIATGGGAVGAA